MVVAPPHGDPNDPAEWEKLTATNAPHEPGAALRLHRAGLQGLVISNVLRVRADQLVQVIRTALEDEDIASRAGRPIHDAVIKKGTK